SMKEDRRQSPPPTFSRPGGLAFTRLELLTLVGALALLAALALPLLGKAKEKARRNQCLNNLKELTIAWHAYATAHNEAVVSNHALQETRARRSNWVNNVLSWGLDADNTNLVLLATGKLAPYVGAATSVYLCPEDRYLSVKQRKAGWAARTRSLALNAFLGGGTVVISGNNLEHEDYVHARKTSEIV